jgi:5-methylcytosine-specific restriction endonuclease McrA
MRRDKADAEFSSLIRARDSWTCRRCGKQYPEKSQALHAAHIFSRSIKKTRHDPENAVALCYGCHSFFHRHPLEFHEWVKGWLGKRKYGALMRRAKRL